MQAGELSELRFPVHIISRKRLKEFWERHPDAKEPLDTWYRAAKRAKWQNLAETREMFPHADPYGTCTIFNIGGNKYRLITKIYYDDQTVLIRIVLTHPEYDRGRWKDDCNN
ncbi:MAG: type II toxin-antitoxin system HigB family toxin [Blastocatellia bacterium]